VVTEAGFGADLGAEKFMNIKCRKAGLAPSAVVLVATVRAMKMNGGVAKADLNAENVEAVKKGCPNLGRHIENVKSFGVPVVVAINHFVSDTDAEVEAVREYVASMGSEAILCKHWAKGSEGIADLATRVAEIADSGVAEFAPLYGDDMSLMGKIETSRSATSSRRGKRPATAICRSAWRRRSTRSRPIRTCAARPRAIPCRSARCG
jgi:formate--tetrahydrofolate ligase